MSTMHDHAVAWVAQHKATCKNENCDCSTGDDAEMVDALIANWLGMEEPS